MLGGQLAHGRREAVERLGQDLCGDVGPELMLVCREALITESAGVRADLTHEDQVGQPEGELEEAVEQRLATSQESQSWMLTCWWEATGT